MSNSDEYLLRKAREAKHGGQQSWAMQSTGEKVAVALVLNRADWLTLMGYTIAEAIERSGLEWVAAIPRIARQLEEEARLPKTAIVATSSWHSQA